MQSITDLLHRAEQSSRAIFAAVPLPFGAKDITIRQYSVLSAISAEPGATQTRLCEITSIDRSTLADLVFRMAQKGLINRSRTGGDRRAYAVTLTDKGETAIGAMRAVADVANNKLLGLLGEEEQLAFRSALEKLADVQLSLYVV
jgi:MarR family transcriptional regulator, temperature-dependent positive regulator of motility